MALNIFANEKMYGGWQKTACMPLSESLPTDVYNAIDSDCEVMPEHTEGYGLSVCFSINGGANRIYKKLSVNSSLKPGDKIKKDMCFVVVLHKQGEEDVYRISETKE